jgi:hypothetical protein
MRSSRLPSWLPSFRTRTRSATLASPNDPMPRGESPPGCRQACDQLFQPNRANVADAALVHKPDVRAFARYDPLRGWRSIRPSTATPLARGPLTHNRKDQRPLTGGQHGWRINRASRWRGWADPDVGMALSVEEELEGVRDGRDFRTRRRDLDRDG